MQSIILGKSYGTTPITCSSEASRDASDDIDWGQSKQDTKSQWTNVDSTQTIGRHNDGYYLQTAHSSSLAIVNLIAFHQSVPLSEHNKELIQSKQVSPTIPPWSKGKAFGEFIPFTSINAHLVQQYTKAIYGE